MKPIMTGIAAVTVVALAGCSSTAAHSARSHPAHSAAVSSSANRSTAPPASEETKACAYFASISGRLQAVLGDAEAGPTLTTPADRHALLYRWCHLARLSFLIYRDSHRQDATLSNAFGNLGFDLPGIDEAIRLGTEQQAAQKAVSAFMTVQNDCADY